MDTRSRRQSRRDRSSIVAGGAVSAIGTILVERALSCRHAGTFGIDLGIRLSRYLTNLFKYSKTLCKARWSYRHDRKLLRVPTQREALSGTLGSLGIKYRGHDYLLKYTSQS